MEQNGERHRPAILKEVQHLARSLFSYPAASGTYYTAQLLHRVQGVEQGEAQRIFQTLAHQGEHQTRYSSFYILLTDRSAVMFSGDVSDMPTPSRDQVWLCLETLLYLARSRNS